MSNYKMFRENETRVFKIVLHDGVEFIKGVIVQKGQKVKVNENLTIFLKT